MKPTESGFGIAAISHMSIRANPDHRSELITQILFGELFVIQNQWNDWLYIFHDATGSEGWIFNQSFVPLTKRETYDESATYSNLEIVYVTRLNDPRHPIALLPGSSLPVQPELGTTFALGQTRFIFEPPLPEKLEITAENRMEALAQIFINAPFLYGGRSLFGMDHTGLSQLVFKMYGVRIPGRLEELVKQGKAVPFAHDSRPGDLAFFENQDGEIIHSGIITQPGKIIHCYGHVREDPIDHAGIYGVSEEKYLFYLRIIKRILPEE